MTKEAKAAGNRPGPETTEVWIGLMRARERVLARIEADFKAAALPPLGWYDVLWELVQAEDGRLRPYEIEARTLLAQYNLSRLIDRLAKEGLVRREAFDADGRGQWVVITEAGRAMRERMWLTYGPSIDAHVGERLSEDEARQLAALLAKLR
ncbi:MULTISPECIES: MarR family winged helix-turn-helix transcriptional regulator [unclassified Ensifer]|uniref:MarR family winged helix-turn-helix transcriptional regulator n=1 Tax=unclassified Ensifer TaxID=2633371 RepID=UPI000812FC75|nr:MULTISPECIES: MarR family winged helix-turn-helix transcriptional regulator [unclassified Ensifer]OCP07499.1 MarR family transcriptional regulator [Ensifer sp. LC11]OCP07605.1 MarR family transcriptional regulator [Ensifer sp. LC14]OCP08273.1 MarR family transcriptional regulator [Ensifer sp. LC13]OCP31994.1 MarR family transcriptional regulator [Ensifer sp. LC499]